MGQACSGQPTTKFIDLKRYRSLIMPSYDHKNNNIISYICDGVKILMIDEGIQ